MNFPTQILIPEPQKLTLLQYRKIAGRLIRDASSIDVIMHSSPDPVTSGKIESKGTCSRVLKLGPSNIAFPTPKLATLSRFRCSKSNSCSSKGTSVLLCGFNETKTFRYSSPTPKSWLFFTAVSFASLPTQNANLTTFLRHSSLIPVTSSKIESKGTAILRLPLNHFMPFSSATAFSSSDDEDGVLDPKSGQSEPREKSSIPYRAALPSLGRLIPDLATAHWSSGAIGPIGNLRTAIVALRVEAVELAMVLVGLMAVGVMFGRLAIALKQLDRLTLPKDHKLDSDMGPESDFPCDLVLPLLEELRAESDEIFGILLDALDYVNINAGLIDVVAEAMYYSNITLELHDTNALLLKQMAAAVNQEIDYILVSISN
ncbi:hypothetical protein LTR49_005204 [Elasticomyces elasticus]|nr:hypothetical protein LTR49_005204 [Elasticomyces elasticus]